MKKKFIYIKIISILVIIAGVAMFPITARADYPVSFEHLDSDQGSRLKFYFNNNIGYCVEHKKPFKTTVDDMENAVLPGTYSEDDPNSGTTLREWAEKNLPSDFRGWGTGQLNGDHTNASAPESASAPSSASHTHPDAPNQWYPPSTRVIPVDEGAKAPYQPRVVLNTNPPPPWDSPQRRIALAILQYYIREDNGPNGVGGYSEETKWLTEQIMIWATQEGYLESTAGNLIGSNAYLDYRQGCDEFVRSFIGSNPYGAMKLYRQVVWKTTNMRMIPSFAKENPFAAEMNPITLHWDADANAYTAVVSDANGMLDYFDFDIPGVTIEKDTVNQTLKITSPGPILTPKVNVDAKQSTLLPADRQFKRVEYYKWTKEMMRIRKQLTYFTYFYLYPSSDHSHYYTPEGCRWNCQKGDNEVDWSQCPRNTNRCSGVPVNNACGRGEHTHSGSCNSLTCTNKAKLHVHGAGCYGRTCGQSEHRHSRSCHYCTYPYCHSHEYARCYHKYHCIHRSVTTGYKYYSECVENWSWCRKQHYRIGYRQTPGFYYKDWQDPAEFEDKITALTDPVYAYISVVTAERPSYHAETDAEVLLVAENGAWNNKTYTTPDGRSIAYADHIRVGEKYHLKYIYSYRGASKGFRIEITDVPKPYYEFSYLAKMLVPPKTTIFSMKDSYFAGYRSIKNAKLVIDPTLVKIRGMYTTAETRYAESAYQFDSAGGWDTEIKLDAMTASAYDSGYTPLRADEITSSNTGRSYFAVQKNGHNNMLVVWEYDTTPEVFSTAFLKATAVIDIGENKNYSKDYFDASYDYGENEEHNNVGGDGFFAMGPGGEQILQHTVSTQNNESATNAIRNKFWQTEVDIQISNFKQNTGAGITQPIKRNRDYANHAINYNLYYTIDVKHPAAAMYQNKQRYYDHATHDEGLTGESYNTSGDVYEFDINNLIKWEAGGAARIPLAVGSASAGNMYVVDHVKTGTTYIQREIPVVLSTLFNTQRDTMRMSVTANADRAVYEDKCNVPSVNGNTLAVYSSSDKYGNNSASADSVIYPAMNPYTARPTRIQSADNVPANNEQGDNILRHENPATAFSIRLSDGTTAAVKDSDKQDYRQYGFSFNDANQDNKVVFPSHRRSVTFYKYSDTNYGAANGYGSISAATGSFIDRPLSQTESYYISQVLFKSNYTTKYKAELKRKGADYIEDKEGRTVTDSWIDMVHQNKFAIVSAGQGFELRVTVKYENSRLTQYLARYYGTGQDDAQNDNDSIGTHNQRQQNALPGSKAYKFCNISALTGHNAGRDYEQSERAYVSHVSQLDRLAVNLVTGSNVYYDLYCSMSDNPDVVYSYSGIYDTPVIFDRDIKYSGDYSVTTATYTMRLSTTNGIADKMQKMKFYTSQLASDSETPGIINNGNLPNGAHSITLWTPIVAATPLGYPADSGTRYIGDAIEIGYTIKSTAADDSTSHIVQ